VSAEGKGEEALMKRPWGGGMPRLGSLGRESGVAVVGPCPG
jgi:hypothetical protein